MQLFSLHDLNCVAACRDSPVLTTLCLWRLSDCHFSYWIATATGRLNYFFSVLLTRSLLFLNFKNNNNKHSFYEKHREWWWGGGDRSNSRLICSLMPKADMDGVLSSCIKVKKRSAVLLFEHSNNSGEMFEVESIDRMSWTVQWAEVKKRGMSLRAMIERRVHGNACTLNGEATCVSFLWFFLSFFIFWWLFFLWGGGGCFVSPGEARGVRCLESYVHVMCLLFTASYYLTLTFVDWWIHSWCIAALSVNALKRLWLVHDFSCI